VAIYPKASRNSEVSTAVCPKSTTRLYPITLLTKLAPTHRACRVGLQALAQALLPEDVAARGLDRIVVRLVVAEGHLVDCGQARRLFTLLLAEIGQDRGAVNLASHTVRHGDIP
jgi:hypothetical protein